MPFGAHDSECDRGYKVPVPVSRKETPPMINITGPEWGTFGKTWGDADAARVFAAGGMP